MAKVSMMKLKTLLLLIWISVASSGRQYEEREQCRKWFPEPLSYKTKLPSMNVSVNLKLIDDFLWDRDMNESRRMVEEYVVNILNEKCSGWALNIGPFVFRHLPSVRQLAISILCIIFSLIIFPFLWKLGFDEFSEILGTKLNIDEYRAGLTILPICCVVSLLIASSNIHATRNVIAEGLDNLETSNDKSFMPIQKRIDKKISISECMFHQESKRIFSVVTPEKRYFELIDKSHLYILDLRVFDNLYQISSKSCSSLKSSVNKEMHYLSNQLDSNLITTTSELHEEYLRLINTSLTHVFPVLQKAIGGIEGFVRSYHENILLIPSIGVISFYQSVINIAVLGTIFISISLTVLMMVGYEFKKKWCQRVVQASVPVTIFFAVLSLLVFIGLIYRICFILLIHQHCEENEFEIFRKANSINISENGHHLSVNYGNVLRESILENTSLFHLASATEQGVPDIINARKLFKPSEKYNETIVKLTQIITDEYEQILMNACEKSRKTFETIEKLIEVEKICTDLGYSEMSLIIINETMAAACEAAEHLKTHSLDKKHIEETAFEKWTEAIHPLKNQSIFYEKTVIDDRNPMQVYMVFENPSKKLRPTILEPMLQMAFLVITVTPMFVLLAVYFICILPLLMGDTEDSESSRPLKSGSGSKSSSKSKSASPSDEKSKTSPSNKQIIAV